MKAKKKIISYDQNLIPLIAVNGLDTCKLFCPSNMYHDEQVAHLSFRFKLVSYRL